MKTIAILNHKGGTGKTTSTSNIGAGLARLNKKTLLIDIDPQANLTEGLGFRDTDVSIYNAIRDDKYKTPLPIIELSEYLHLIPSSLDLLGAELELVSRSKRESILEKLLEGVKGNYDYIIIDCPPSLSMLTINAMTTADSVLVPIQCEYYALEGLSQLIHTVELVKERLNPVLEIEGVVFTMYDARTNLSLQVVENVKENLQQNIYKTIIPRNIRLAEAPSYGMPINLYDPKSTGASAYQRLADEVMNRE